VRLELLTHRAPPDATATRFGSVTQQRPKKQKTYREHAIPIVRVPIVVRAHVKCVSARRGCRLVLRTTRGHIGPPPSTRQRCLRAACTDRSRPQQRRHLHGTTINGDERNHAKNIYIRNTFEMIS
jgi:hypothetical protein